MKTFIGIEFDAAEMQIRITREKLDAIRDQLQTVIGTGRLTPHDAQSLWGRLQWATQAATRMRPFITPLRILAASAKRVMRLRSEHLRDLRFIRDTLTAFNGTAMMPVMPSGEECVIYSDASTSTGYGWFSPTLGTHAYGVWPTDVVGGAVHINELEAATAIQAVLEALERGARRITVYSDNAATVRMMGTGKTASPCMWRLLRILATATTAAGAYLVVHHLQGVKNTIADQLSRGDASLLSSLHGASTKIQHSDAWESSILPTLRSCGSPTVTSRTATPPSSGTPPSARSKAGPSTTPRRRPSSMRHWRSGPPTW